MQLPIVNKFKSFCGKIFGCFSFQSNVTLELFDALSGKIDIDSVAQLSLTLLLGVTMVAFEMLFNFETDCEQYVRIAQYLINFCSSITKTQPFRLMVSDGTAVPRKSPKALKDRGMVHAFNVIR